MRNGKNRQNGKRLRRKRRTVLLVKPMSFMNHSGHPLLAIAQFYKIAPEEILIVLDDFALPLGRLRIRADGGTGGHNGLESIIVQFGSEQISRLRVGIGSAPRDARAVDYVLGRFLEEEKFRWLNRAIDRAVEAVKCAIDKGLVSAMNKFQRRNRSAMTKSKNHEESLRSVARAEYPGQGRICSRHRRSARVRVSKGRRRD